MPERRRRFSPQFKAEAVHMVVGTGKPVAEGEGSPGCPETSKPGLILRTEEGSHRACPQEVPG